MNPSQRDDIHGTAASASAENYRKRREGNLTRQSDGFRTPYPLAQPRGPVQQGYKPDEHLRPYYINPASRPGDPFPNVPRNFIFFRPMDLGAPYVGFPDQARTQGHLQQSGAAWGRVGEPPRAVMMPPTNGTNAPPAHSMGTFRPLEKVSMGPRWVKPGNVYKR